MVFVVALCSALAAAAWQGYGDTAQRMISNFAPPFAPTSSPPQQQTSLAGQPGSAAVQAPAADRTDPPPSVYRHVR